MTARIQVVFDAADPHAQAAWWAEAAGYEVEDHTAIVDGLIESGRLQADEAVRIGDRHQFRDVAACRDAGGRPRLFFQVVPEAKTVKNRVHLDLQVGPDAVDAEVDRLLGLGATHLWTTTIAGPKNVTLADPEGNELCVS